MRASWARAPRFPSSSPTLRPFRKTVLSVEAGHHVAREAHRPRQHHVQETLEFDLRYIRERSLPHGSRHPVRHRLDGAHRAAASVTDREEPWNWTNRPFPKPTDVTRSGLPTAFARGHPQNRNGYALMDDLESPVVRFPLLREMERFQTRFMARTRPVWTDNGNTGDRLD